MVGITAYFVLRIDEAVMDNTAAYELGDDASVLQKDGTEALQLRFLLSVDDYFVSVFHPGTDVRGEEFEVLVENGLRRYGKNYLLIRVAGHRSVYIYFLETLEPGKEILVRIHIRRIQP